MAAPLKDRPPSDGADSEADTGNQAQLFYSGHFLVFSSAKEKETFITMLQASLKQNQRRFQVALCHMLSPPLKTRYSFEALSPIPKPIEEVHFYRRTQEDLIEILSPYYIHHTAEDIAASIDRWQLFFLYGAQHQIRYRGGPEDILDYAKEISDPILRRRQIGTAFFCLLPRDCGGVGPRTRGTAQTKAAKDKPNHNNT